MLLYSVDVIVVPIAPLMPTIAQVQNDPIGVNTSQSTYTDFVNLADLSALAVPAGFCSDGLPFGITFLSRSFNDYDLLEFAARYLNNSLEARHYGYTQDRAAKSYIDIYLPHHVYLPHDVHIPHDELPNKVLTNMVKLAVVGAHLKGSQLHWQLEKVHACYTFQTNIFN